MSDSPTIETGKVNMPVSRSFYSSSEHELHNLPFSISSGETSDLSSEHDAPPTKSNKVKIKSNNVKIKCGTILYNVNHMPVSIKCGKILDNVSHMPVSSSFYSSSEHELHTSMPVSISSGDNSYSSAERDPSTTCDDNDDSGSEHDVPSTKRDDVKNEFGTLLDYVNTNARSLYLLTIIYITPVLLYFGPLLRTRNSNQPVSDSDNSGTSLEHDQCNLPVPSTINSDIDLELDAYDAYNLLESSSDNSNSNSERDTSSKCDDNDDSSSEPDAPPTRWDKIKIKLGKIKDAVNMKAQYLYLFMMMYVLPMLLYFGPLSLISVFFWVGYGSMIAVSTNLVAELFGSLHSWKVRRLIHRSNIKIPPQHMTAIVSAYLSNEIDILEDTLMAIRKCKLPPECTLTILVSHNGGKPHHVQQLRDIIRDLKPRRGFTYDELDNPSSRSKAENVNGALDYLKDEEAGTIRPEVVVLYDADHQPDENAMIYALETMIFKNADLLQGRCCINRGTTMIAAEFDTLYGVNHAGGEVIHGFAFFGGTNGFWKFDLLDEIRMDTSMLTEDVDSAFRSLASGANVVYDPMVVSYEEAPPSFQILIKQRLRWTQGWSEVAVRHIPLIWKKEFSLRRRFMIAFLLHFRELYFYTSGLVLPTAIAFGLRKKELIINLPLLLVGVCPLLLPIIMTLVAHYQMPSVGHPDLGPKEYVQYFFVSIPYELLKVMIAVLGHYRNLAGINKWEITTRIVPTKTGDAEESAEEDDDVAVQEEVETQQLINTDAMASLASSSSASSSSDVEPSSFRMIV